MAFEYLYETHLHTSPVSACARSSVRDSLEFYKAQGYAGVFITNHFIDGNISVDKSLSYETQIKYCFSDYEAALSIGKELEIQVLPGVEISYARVAPFAPFARAIMLCASSCVAPKASCWVLPAAPISMSKVRGPNAWL